MDQALEHRSIVIVGGTTGLGLSAALACRRAGAEIVVVGRNAESAPAAEAAAADAGGEIRAVVGDATDPATTERAVATAIERSGRLDGLYHVAGGSGRRHGDGPLHEATDEGIDFTIALNLRSVLLSNRVAIRQFLAQKSGGSILNMSSVLGSSPSPRHFTTHVYAATKAAIDGLTRSLAAHYAEHDIRVNAIAPALVETPMSRRAQEDADVLAFIRSKQPLDGGRIGRSEDVDAAVVYFLSDRSRFVTGQVLAVDGGWSVSEGQYASPERESDDNPSGDNAE